MPFSLRLADQLIQVDLHGEITVEDFQALIRAIFEAEKGLPRTPDRISDFTAATGIGIRYEDVNSAVAARLANPPLNPIRNAIVAPKPAQFGMARMYQMLCMNNGVTVEIFTERSAALAWLATPPPPAT